MPLPRRFATAALATAAVTLTTVAGALPGHAATYNAFGGSAYASSANVGTLATSGQTSYATLCTTQLPASSSNNTAKLNLGAVGYVGAATTRVSSVKTSSTKAAVTTVQVAATSLLAGLVQAKAITATSSVTSSSKGYTPAGSSVFTDLRVGGKAITARPKSNTKIDIPGVATVLLNAQSSSSAAGTTASNVTALRVTLLKGNKLGLPVGSVVVGAANATQNRPTHHRAFGTAFGTQLNVASILGSGRTAAVYLPCGGTSGAVRTNSVASALAPGLLKVGAIKSSAKSTDNASATTAVTTTSLAKVDLLAGVVTLDAVNVSATATRKGTKVALSSSGTKIAGLKINGKAVQVNVKENTTVSIAGVGTLYLHRVTKTSSSVQVYGVQLVLNTDRAGLKKGTTLTAGAAWSGVAYH